MMERDGEASLAAHNIGQAFAWKAVEGNLMFMVHELSMPARLTFARYVIACKSPRI